MLCFVISATAASGSSCYGSGPNSHFFYIFTSPCFPLWCVDFPEIKKFAMITQRFSFREKPEQSSLDITDIIFLFRSRPFTSYRGWFKVFSFQHTFFFNLTSVRQNSSRTPLYLHAAQQQHGNESHIQTPNTWYTSQDQLLSWDNISRHVTMGTVVINSHLHDVKNSSCS